MRLSVFTILILVGLLLNCRRSFDNDRLFGPYFGQKIPGDNPEMFMPGVISTGSHDMAITISNDLKKIYVGRSAINWTSAIVAFEENEEGWSGPGLPEFASDLKNNYPAFSPDNRMIFFNRTWPMPGNKQQVARKIWFSSLSEKGWNSPKMLESETDLAMHMAYPSVAANGNIYFNSTLKGGEGKSDICRLIKTENGYGEPESLGPQINSEHWEFHPYISPEEDYIIFDAIRAEGFGSNDLYISFRLPDGSWSKAMNMGSTINGPDSDMRPYVSPDRKYLFFCSNRSVEHNEQESAQLNYKQFSGIISGPGNGSQDIYWMDAKIINDLKIKTLVN